MASGVTKFREFFGDYKDQYVVIGGTACDLLMEQSGFDFRLTKDIDMVLVVEALTDDFSNKFWKFIEAGGYTARRKKTGRPEFYRFVKPTEPGYPTMIELFARPDNKVDFEYKGNIVPIHLGEEISSLSAILLNDDYYQFLLNGRVEVDGIMVLKASHIVPLKMKAWLDLTATKGKGEHVNDRDLRKHRLDVFRMFPIVDISKPILVPEQVYNDIMSFIESMNDTPYDLKSIGIDIDIADILDEYGKLYIRK
mgnify:FL=1